MWSIYIGQVVLASTSSLMMYKPHEWLPKGCSLCTVMSVPCSSFRNVISNWIFWFWRITDFKLILDFLSEILIRKLKTLKNIKREFTILSLGSRTMFLGASELCLVRTGHQCQHVLKGQLNLWNYYEHHHDPAHGQFRNQD